MKSAIKLCSARWPGGACSRPYYGHGFCKTHWRQWRQGRTLGPIRSQRSAGASIAIIKDAIETATDECLCPFGPGPKVVTVNGSGVLIARAAWILAFGDPGVHQVLHSCSDGAGKASGCINIRHLRLGTNGENVLDRTNAGRGNWGVLDENAAREIRRRWAGGYHGNTVALAVEYGVGRKAIWLIGTGRTWRHL